MLSGTITDGDVRRSLLNGCALSDKAIKAANKTPQVATIGMSKMELLTLLNKYQFRQMPLVEEHGAVVGLAHIDDLQVEVGKATNPVVLMAGGLGERLRPLTNKTPKPLLQIGDKPLLQSILESFVEQNFQTFYIAVNYQADAIKDHFGDGSSWGVNICYLEEKNRMGTAGALTLLPEEPTEPVIVMNGDLVTRTRFQDLLDFHAEQNSKATMCVREYDFQVPFGVVSIDDNRICSIDEKPLHRFFVNAGIYVLDPNVIAAIPKDERTDMTRVFERTIAEGNETAAFPIHEYWLDIGRIDDLERAQSDFAKGHDK